MKTDRLADGGDRRWLHRCQAEGRGEERAVTSMPGAASTRSGSTLTWNSLEPRPRPRSCQGRSVATLCRHGSLLAQRPAWSGPRTRPVWKVRVPCGALPHSSRSRGRPGPREAARADPEAIVSPAPQPGKETGRDWLGDVRGEAEVPWCAQTPPALGQPGQPGQALPMGRGAQRAAQRLLPAPPLGARQAPWLPLDLQASEPPGHREGSAEGTVELEQPGGHGLILPRPAPGIPCQPRPLPRPQASSANS